MQSAKAGIALEHSCFRSFYLPSAVRKFGALDASLLMKVLVWSLRSLAS